MLDEASILMYLFRPKKGLDLSVGETQVPSPEVAVTCDYLFTLYTVCRECKSGRQGLEAGEEQCPRDYVMTQRI